MWVFGYGSLLWYTDFPYEEAIPGQVQDYVRRFWQLSPDHRGTPEKPGRVVSLVAKPGGACWGIAYKIPEHAVESSLAYLNFRERAGYKIEELTFHPDDGSPSFALSVYLPIKTTDNIYHTGPTEEEEIVRSILTCRGRSGSNLEYALRLADCQRRLAPHVNDDHLFGIETRLLTACEQMKCRDEILIRLNHKLGYLLDCIDEAAKNATEKEEEDDLQRRIRLHQRLIDEQLQRNRHRRRRAIS